MTRQHLHGLAALLLIAGAGLYMFTETLAPAIAGMACTVASALLMLFAWHRDKGHQAKVHRDNGHDDKGE